MKKSFIVAIDGTAGSGKSTTARKAAEVLGFFYLDTGAMYRAITWKILKSKIDLNDTEGLKKLLAKTKINFNNKGKIMLDGKDVSKTIRKPVVDKLVSQVSALPIVRTKMVKEQRRIAKNRNVICEGRDIGSVVFPKADLKFYLDCHLDERTRRRVKELREKGIKATPKAVKENFLERDYIDSTRATSPLKKMPDAVFLDTTNLTIEEEVEFVTNLIKERLHHKRATGSK
ncbi:MAG: (d)CMP kinase [candidate division WOR-3 bacterium]